MGDPARKLSSIESSRILLHGRGKTIRTNPLPTSEPPASNPADAKLLGEADSEILASLPPKVQRKVLKRIQGFTFNKMYSLALGLPGRARKFVEQCWKREEKWGESPDKISCDLAATANKILEQRMELVLFTSLAVRREGIDDSEGQLTRMTEAKNYCDAILCLYARYFLIGMSARVAVQSTYYAGDEAHLGGLIDVIDHGRLTPNVRKKRQHQAESLMKTNGWEFPKRRF